MSATEEHITPSAAEIIVRDILKGLYEGRYVAGQRLAEPDLSARYGVSRSTVREAIKRLAVQGVVEIRRHQGARILNVSSDEARNVLLIAAMLVGLAARQSAGAIDKEGNREALQEALDDLARVSASREKFDVVVARNKFHRTLALIAGSPVLENTMTNLQVHLVRNKLVMTPEQRLASYQSIAEAIFAGDADKAEARAQAHVRVMIDLLEQET